jgi:DNA-binding FadR family transcriptional regulator
MAAVDTVLNEIKGMNLVEGDRLPSERKLAEKCGISRSSVRNALKELESRRVLAVRRGSGYFLSSGFALQQVLGGKDAEWNIGRVRQVLEARSLVSARVTELSSREMTSQQLQDLENCLVDLGRAIINIDTRNIDSLHNRFVNIIQESCTNRELIRMLNEVRIPSHYIVTLLQIAGGDDRNAFFSEHVNLFQAIRKKEHSLAAEVSDRLHDYIFELFKKYSRLISY